MRWRCDMRGSLSHACEQHRRAPGGTALCCHHGVMARIPFDAQERRALCEQFERLGPDAPTLITAWSAHDLAAHLVLRERDLLAGPCLVLPGPFARFAERRRTKLAQRREFGWLIERIGSGPPLGFFRFEWVRSLANLNEFFVHHEDLRRANGLPPRRSLTPETQKCVVAQCLPQRPLLEPQAARSRVAAAMGRHHPPYDIARRPSLRTAPRPARRIAVVSVRTPGCSPGRRDGSGCCRRSGASNAFRDVSCDLTEWLGVL